MKNKRSFLPPVLFLATAALGAVIGNHLQHLRESELFYRWIQSQAMQARMASNFAPDMENAERIKAETDFFGEVATKSAAMLQDVADQKDPRGEVQAKLVTAGTTEAYDWRVWEMASGPALAAERAKFLVLLRGKKLTTSASEFDPNAVYSNEAGVSLGNVFLGFRKIAANFVWLQVDRYWHQGYMQRMIPLMKTCVTLDPSFVDAFLLGAWHLAYNATAKMTDTPEPLKVWSDKYQARIGEKEKYYYLGAEFLQDGIAKNPRNYRLHFDLGYAIYNIKLRDYQRAVEHLSEAVRCRHDVWVPRMLYICLEKNKQYAEALAGWEDFLSKATDEVNIEKGTRFVARNKALMKEQAAEKLVQQAAADPAQADGLRQQAEALRKEAQEIYRQMGGEDLEKGDPFAVGRLMRMKAVELAENQQYLEAVAVLENARWKSPEFFEEACDMIIAYKQEGNIPLSISEQKAVLRQQEKEKYQNQQGAAPATS